MNIVGARGGGGSRRWWVVMVLVVLATIATLPLFLAVNPAEYFRAGMGSPFAAPRNTQIVAPVGKLGGSSDPRVERQTTSLASSGGRGESTSSSSSSERNTKQLSDVTFTPQATSKVEGATSAKKNRGETLDGCSKKTSRDGPDHSHLGLEPDENGIHHAWKWDPAVGGSNTSNKKVCHGVGPDPSCISAEAVEWFRKHVLFGIASGKEGSFRVEVSQCSWLSHFPPENVFVFTDRKPTHPLTPHHWVELGLPDGVYIKNCDLFSPFVPKGYIHEVRAAGMGYSAGWIAAQFRFGTGLQYMLDEAAKRGGPGSPDEILYIVLGDDDTIVNINNLVRRLKGIKYKEPYYFSRTGWGGAGHIWSLGAMKKLQPASGLQDCIERYFIKGFRASDTMLLKCSKRLNMHIQKESTMSHCPAATAGSKITDPNQITFHAKKDFYPPVLRTTWRTALYYRAMYCRDTAAGEEIVRSSSCAYGGSCRVSTCQKQHDQEKDDRWRVLSKNNTLDALPADLFLSAKTKKARQ